MVKLLIFVDTLVSVNLGHKSNTIPKIKVDAVNEAA